MQSPLPAARRRRCRFTVLCRMSGAFTLIELLVVVAILSILAALLLPVLARARDRGRQTTCLAHLRQLAIAHQLYVRDWDEQFPAWWQEGPPRPEPFGPRVYWPEMLRPYTG